MLVGYVLFYVRRARRHTIGGTTNARKQPSTFKPNGASRPAPSFPQHPTPVTICQYRADWHAGSSTDLAPRSTERYIKSVLITGVRTRTRINTKISRRPTARRERATAAARTAARGAPLSDWPHWGPCGKLVESRPPGRGGRRGRGPAGAGRRPAARPRAAAARVVDCRIVRAYQSYVHRLNYELQPSRSAPPEHRIDAWTHTLDTSTSRP